jgi:Tfp pilus assembly protein PilO
VRISNLKLKTIQTAVVSLYIAGTVLAGFLVATRYLDYTRHAADFKSRQARLLQLEKDSSQLQELLAKYADEKEKFASLLFKEQDIPAFLEEISGSAVKAHVTVSTIATRSFVRVKYKEIDESVSAAGKARLSADAKNKSAQDDTGSVLVYLPIEVTIQGKFESLVEFLVSLEKYKQLVTLSDVEIKTKKYPQLECKFVVNIYSLRDLESVKT